MRFYKDGEQRSLPKYRCILAVNWDYKEKILALGENCASLVIIIVSQILLKLLYFELTEENHLRFFSALLSMVLLVEYKIERVL